MYLSPSQLKTYNASPAKWAGRYILWIKDPWFWEDSMVVWSMVETWLMTWKDDFTLMDGKDIDREAVLAKYEAAKFNATWLDLPIWQAQVKVEWELFWVQFVWYIDNLTDKIWDIKTSYYLSKDDQTAKNNRSNLTYQEEYALQLWIYMKLTGVTKAAIAEVGTYLYKDGRNSNQIIDFELTDEFDKEMTEKREPKIKEMVELYKKYKSD